MGEKTDLWLSGLIALAAFWLYWYTLAPTVVWGDPAKLTVYAYLLHLKLWPSNHALHNLIGWLWGKLSFSNYAYGQNVLSAVFAALAVAVMYRVGRRAGCTVMGAAAGAAALAASHSFWWLAVVNESYSVLYFLLAGALLCALAWWENGQDRWLYLLWFTVGLAASNNLVILIFAPVFAGMPFLKAARQAARPALLVGMALALLAGSSLLLYLYLMELRVDTWDNALRTALGAWSPEGRAGWKGLSQTVRDLPRYPIYLLYQFPGFGIILGLWGALAAAAKDRKRFLFLAALLLVNVLFATGFMRERQPWLLVPGYMVLAIWLGYGFDEVMNRARGSDHPQGRLVLSSLLLASLVLIPLATYHAVPPLVKRLGLRLYPASARQLPYRDNDYYFYLPSKRGYDGAERFAAEVFRTIEPNGIVLADFTPHEVLRYFQLVEGARPDVLLVPVSTVARRSYVHLLEEECGRRPIYLADIHRYQEFYDLEQISRRYVVEPAGPIFKVCGGSPAAAG